MIRKLALAFFALLVLFVLWEWITFPDVAEVARKAPETTAFMELRKRQLRAAGKDDTLEYRFVPYWRISPNLRRAVLVSEDNTFYEHGGVDVEGMKEALKKDWEKGKLSHGGSTITQQLAKNLYLSPSRNPVRKIREYFIAKSLENNLTKKRILELYLNVAELGERTYGAEAAARRYFGKSAAGLTPSEAALLAGSLPNPRVMSPASPNRRLRARQRIILSRLRRWGYLYEAQVLTDTRKKPKEEKAAEPATDTDLTSPETDTSEAAPDATETTDTTGTTMTEPSTDTSSPEPPAEEPAPTETTTAPPPAPPPGNT